MKTDTTEKGLESLIVQSLVAETGYVQGDPQDYDREHDVDLAKIIEFLQVTQAEKLETLHLNPASFHPSHLTPPMKNNDKKTARIEHDAALQCVMIDLLSDHTELFKQFSDNPSFKKWLGDTIFGVTYQQQAMSSRREISFPQEGP